MVLHKEMYLLCMLTMLRKDVCSLNEVISKRRKPVTADKIIRYDLGVLIVKTISYNYKTDQLPLMNRVFFISKPTGQ